MNDPLADIFNTSIKFSRFPEKMRTLKDTPIFESGKEKLLKNYKPMSVLPFLSKFQRGSCITEYRHT